MWIGSRLVLNSWIGIIIIIIIIAVRTWDLGYILMWIGPWPDRQPKVRHINVSHCGGGAHLGLNRLRIRILAVSDSQIYIIYPMFIESTINQVPSGFSGYIIKAWYKNCI